MIHDAMSDVVMQAGLYTCIALASYENIFTG